MGLVGTVAKKLGGIQFGQLLTRQLSESKRRADGRREWSGAVRVELRLVGGKECGVGVFS